MPGTRGALAPVPLQICCVLLVFLSAAESLEVDMMSRGPLKALLNENVTMPCKFSGYSSVLLDIRTVGVRWTRITVNGEVKVHEFDGGNVKHTSHRPGSTLLEREIKEGNAALHLPQVQFHEEGAYKCVVFVTPSKGEGTLSLQVSAQPTVVLWSTEVEVVSGTEKSLSCHVERFYPQSFKISWKAYSKTKQEHVVIAKNICTESPGKNPDDTFNVTSNLRIHPSLQENGNVFTCIVEHRSLSRPLLLESTLKVIEPDLSTGSITGIVFGTIIICALVSGICIVVHNKYFKKDAPKVTQITGNEVFVHMEKANLSCQITGFRPEKITVTISLKQNGIENPLYHWKTETRTHRYAWKSKRSNAEINPEASTLLQDRSEDVEKVEAFHFETKMESHKDGTSSIQCNMCLVPDIDQHNRSELCLSVEHETVIIHRTRLLKVDGVPPKLSEIVIPARILHQESFFLTCPINGFKPKPLTITWIKKDHNDEEVELVKYDSVKNESEHFFDKYSHTQNESKFLVDKTFSIFSVLTFAPSVKEDNGVRFFCRIHHHATNNQNEKMHKLLVTARPKLDAIIHIPEMPCTEESLTLTCRIHSFFPQTLEVNWYKDNELMSETVNNTDVITGLDGLCFCTSRIAFTPRIEDIGKNFICSVSHESLKNHKGMMNPKVLGWQLKNLISFPKRLEVVCDSDVLEQDKSSTLSCLVKDYYPPECTVRWFKGFEPIGNTELEDPQLDRATGLYRRQSQITIMPTKEDHNTEFAVEVNHCNRQQRTTYHMILKGLPSVEDITLDPKVAAYGQPLTLSCKVAGCSPKDITVSWFQKDVQIQKGLTTKGPTVDNKDHIITYYLLQIMPTALHFNKEFVFMVGHRNLTQSIKKTVYLHLKAQPPLLSDFEVTPAEPEVNRAVCMEIKVSHFVPKDIQVKWYKVWQEFSEEVFRSEPEIGEKGLYCATSKLTFIPKETDSGALIRCEVTHCAAKKVLQKHWQLNLKGCFTNSKKDGESSHIQSNGVPNHMREPQIQKEAKSSEIRCLTNNPRAGEAVTLTYFIDGCNRNDACISWSKGMFPIDEDAIQNLDEGSGFSSTVTFQTDRGDKECEIKCEVASDFEMFEKTYVLKLS